MEDKELLEMNILIPSLRDLSVSILVVSNFIYILLRWG